MLDLQLLVTLSVHIHASSLFPRYTYVPKMSGLRLWKQHFVQKSNSMMLVYSLCKTKQIGS